MNAASIRVFFFQLGHKVGRAVSWPCEALAGFVRGFRSGSGL